MSQPSQSQLKLDRSLASATSEFFDHQNDDAPCLAIPCHLFGCSPGRGHVQSINDVNGAVSRDADTVTYVLGHNNSDAITTVQNSYRSGNKPSKLGSQSDYDTKTTPDTVGPRA
jgi:hypothetical protein